jgi:hypothetical protein
MRETHEADGALANLCGGNIENVVALVAWR